MTNLAEGLAKSLKEIGVKYVFGIPGGPSIPYMDAMHKNGIEFVTVGNEQSAGMMADVFGRLTGIPGVCHATFGPGATNLSTGVGGALLDRSPLLAFTSEFRDEDLGRRIQMNIDHQALFQPVTKWTARLSNENFNATMSKAFAVATSENPGPVHIGLPTGTDGNIISPDDVIIKFEKFLIASPDQLQLEKSKNLIENAKRPIIAVGLTAMRHKLHESVREFAMNNNIPVVLTPMAKGIIPESNPCYAGVLFHSKSDYVASIYRNADLVIGIGYDSIEFNYESWMPNVPLIHFDTEALDITAEYQETLEVLGRLDESMLYLNSLSLPKFDWDLKEVEDNKNKMFEALVAKTEKFNPAEAIQVLQNVLPEDGILTCDVGAHTHLLGQLWKVNEKGRLIMTNGWSTMGFGIPSAIGAKLCEPTTKVACVTGDGGFLMNCGELMVARRMGINVVIVVLVDEDYSLIKVKQEWKKVDQYATFVNKGEYFNADSFLGVPIVKVQDKEEMKIALENAFTMDGPVIIEAIVDGSVYSDLIIRNYK